MRSVAASPKIRPARGAPHDRARGSRMPAALPSSAGHAPCSLSVPRGGARRDGCPHPHTSTLAAELRPSSRKGLTAVAMRPRTKALCADGGSTLPPPLVELYQPSEISPMPTCQSCLHRSEDHNWRVPACSLCGGRDAGACPQCARNRELRRVRGACLAAGRERRCICSKYVPVPERPRSADLFTGRRFSLKRRFYPRR